MLDVLIFLIDIVRSLINVESSLLSLMIQGFLESMYSLTIGMMIVRGAWSDESLQSEWIE